MLLSPENPCKLQVTDFYASPCFGSATTWVYKAVPSPACKRETTIVSSPAPASLFFCLRSSYPCRCSYKTILLKIKDDLNLTGLRRPANKCTSPINRENISDFPVWRYFRFRFSIHTTEILSSPFSVKARKIFLHILIIYSCWKANESNILELYRDYGWPIYTFLCASLRVKCSSWSLSWASVAANSMSQPLQNVDSVMHPAQDIGKYSTSRTILHKTQSDHGHIFYY